MRRLLGIIGGILVSTSVLAKEDVSVIITDAASSPERIAANELIQHLKDIYPDDDFSLNNHSGGKVIRIGTPLSAPDLLKHVDAYRLKGPESYVVTTATMEGKETGIILGADPQGVMYGVYGLLEKLGYGFFISFDTTPQPSGDAFSFKQWNLADHPVVPERIVFNWHNFLTGCSGWDLEQWNHWIDQTQKTGYNTVMIHAYGNNPMFTFELNGEKKPVGYLTSSVKGRDWSVNHVNDVRRLAGGVVFDQPTFGCEPALVEDDERIEAVQSMMSTAFEHARQRGVKINFAVDFDVPSCNPPNIIKTLDEEDRFKIRGVWIARPDTPGGYEFYKAQAKSMVETYPQVTTVTLWRRKDDYTGATWPELKKEEMPEAWQAEYDAIIAQDPAAAELHQSVPAFGMAKVAAAWRKALDELGRQDMELATGSWGFQWVDGCAKFFPEEVKLIALDYDVTHGPGEFRNETIMQRIDQAVQPGRFIPVIWAHHDDGQYIGTPLPDYKQFGSELGRWHTGGFGIIHWMTHPLDIFFASHSRQTWSATLDEDIPVTSRWMAERCFGKANRELMGDYLTRWYAEMPSFGRETSDFFIDRPMSRYGKLERILADSASRLEMLAKANTALMTESQKNRHGFFVEHEKFVADLFRTQTTFEQAQRRFNSGNISEARELIQRCNPEAVLDAYAKAASKVGITRGEEGLIVTMNTRWIPHYVRFRQQLGLEAVRFNYGPTSHEPLAQSKGIFTFHLSPDKEMWQTFGEEETGAQVFSSDSLDEICQHGITSSQPISIEFSPILPKGSRFRLSKKKLPAGNYRLKLYLTEPTAEKSGERIVGIEIPGQAPVQVDIFKAAGGKNKPLVLEYPVKLDEPGNPLVKLVPVKGEVLVCGAELIPVHE